MMAPETLLNSFPKKNNAMTTTPLRIAVLGIGMMGLPMALYVANTARLFLVRWAYRAAAGLAIYGVYLTNSRGGLLSLGAMSLAYSMLRYGFWRKFR